MDSVVLVALAGVRPVGNVQLAPAARVELNSAKPRVGCLNEVGTVFAGECRSVAVQCVAVDSTAMQIHCQHRIEKLLRPVRKLSDNHSAVSVPAAGLVGCVRDAELPDVAPVFLRVPVKVVGGLLDDVVNVRVKVLAVHPPVIRAGDDVPQMADDRVDVKRFAVRVPVHAPCIRAAVADDFELVASRMEPPDAAIDLRPLIGSRSRRTNWRGRENPVSTIKPAIGSPPQAVDDVVPHSGIVPAVEHDDGFAVRLVVSVFVRDEQQVGRVEHPDSAVTDLDTGEPTSLVPENRSLVELTVVIFIFEDDDPVTKPIVEVALPLGVRIILGDPQSPARVRRQSDRLPHIGLGGEQSRLEPLRQFERSQRLLRRERRLAFLRVFDLREVIRESD